MSCLTKGIPLHVFGKAMEVSILDESHTTKPFLRCL